MTDSIEKIDGFYPMISFFKKLYSIYSISPKRCRDLTDIVEELEIQLKKIGKFFGIRWVASSYRTMNAVWSNYQALYARIDTSKKCYIHLTRNQPKNQHIKAL